MQKKYSLLVILALAATIVFESLSYGQTAYFADGYHGGVYGHYPMWQAKFMVDELVENPDWKINLEIEPETWDVVAEKDADNYKRLKDYYKTAGQFGRIEFVNPSFAQPYCYNISGESIIRQFQYGMEKTVEHFPEASFTSYSCEEPCFTSSLPQILTSLGFKYAVLRNPNTCWGGYTTAFGKDLVNWKSSDGSSILTVPRYACEELVKDSTWQTASWNNSTEFIEACLNDGVQYPVGMCFQDAGWRHGPWLENAIGSFYQPTEHVVWTDYIEMVAPKVTPTDWDFSVEDVKPGLVWGSQVLQKLAQEIRHTENRLVMAEKIAAFGTVFHATEYPTAELDEAWRNLMLSQHHDCWIVPYNRLNGHTWAQNVSQWTDKADHIADAAVENVFSQIASDEFDGSFSVIVFNTLAQPRTDLVRVDLPDSIDADKCQVHSADGQIMWSQIINGDDGENLIFKATAPAVGYSTYKLLERNRDDLKPLKAERLKDGSVQVDTNFYSAVIDPSKGGTITSLVAKKMGNLQLVKKNKGLNHLRGCFYKDEKFVSTYEQQTDVSIVEQGSLLACLQVEGEFHGHPFTQTITFYNDNPRIDFDLHINWQSREPGIGAYSQEESYHDRQWKKAFYNDKYKLQVRFPLKGVGERIFKNAPFDVCESELNNTYYDSWDSIKHNVVLNWVDVTDDAGEKGVALFSDHTTSYVNSDKLPLGLTVQYAGRALWGRYYGVDRPTEIRYAILPHAGMWDELGVHAKSVAWNEPLVVSVTKAKPLHVKRSLVEIGTEGVELTSAVIKDGDLLVRLFNAEASEDTVTVDINCHPERIELVQLNGNVIKGLEPVSKGKHRQQIRLRVPRFGFRTIRLGIPAIDG